MSKRETITGPEAWRIDYQAAADALHDSDYATHARKLIGFLSDEITDTYHKNTPFPAEIEEVVTGKAFFLFDMREVPTPPDLIATRTYLLKESRIVGAYGISIEVTEPRPKSTSFTMRRMYGPAEEAFGRSYDTGHFICHGAGGGGNWNLFPQLRPLNRGWSDEGKLYRKMESYVAANQGAMFFHRPIYLDGSLCPALLEYGILMPNREIWWSTFSNTPGEKGHPYGRTK